MEDGAKRLPYGGCGHFIKGIWMTNRITHQKTARWRESGNVFFALFGAVGLVGVLGAASMTILKGPVAGMQKVTKYTVAENAMIAAGRLSIVAANSDCDDDAVNEPLEWADAGAEPAPSGGGLIPSAIGAAKQDPWGNTYGYCVWDHGAAIDNAGCGGASQNRLAGDADIESDAGGIVIALISSGPDRVFQTSCGDDPDYVTKPSGSDDIVLTYTYGEASDLAGGLWQPKGDETAEIARDLEVYSAADPNTQIFGLDSASDPTKPSIKVDFIQKLSAGAPGVTFLSDLLVDGGKVGIGTSSPSGKLHILGGTGASEWLLRLQSSGLGNHSGFWQDASNNLEMGLRDGSDNLTTRIRSAGSSYINGGNVGIGTTNPTYPLSIASSSGPAMIQAIGAGNSTDFSGIRLASDEATDKVWQIVHRKGAPNINKLMYYYYDGSTWTNSMTIQPDGNVGIGTTSPTRPLHIVGAGNAGTALLESTEVFSGLRFKANSTGASKDLLMHYGGNSAAQQNQLRFGRYGYDGGVWEASPIVFDMDAPANSLNITDDGNVGIGLAGPSAKLHVNGGTSMGIYARTDGLPNGVAVTGFSGHSGSSTSNVGVSGIAAGQTASGVRGSATHTTGVNYGVYGSTASPNGYGGYFTNGNGGAVSVKIGNGAIDMSSNKVINLATPTAASDAATKAYVDTTAADAAAAAADNLGNHTATQNLNMANKKIVSLAGPTAGTDAATKAYVDLAAAGAADNLGNHTATQTLAMGAYGISSSAGVIRDGNGGWVRTYGNTGWYNGTHGGGWYMIDTDWVRAYLNKNVITGGVIRADGGFNVDGFDTISSNGSELRLRHTTAGGYTSIRMDGADSTKTLRLHYGGSSDNTLRFGSYADNFSATWNGNPVIFDLDAPTDSLRVHDNGNVGIGLAAPTARLHVAGTGKFTGAVDMTSQKITNLANPTAAQDAATKAYVDANTGGAPCTKTTANIDVTGFATFSGTQTVPGSGHGANRSVGLQAQSGQNRVRISTDITCNNGQWGVANFLNTAPESISSIEAYPQVSYGCGAPISPSTCTATATGFSCSGTTTRFLYNMGEGTCYANGSISYTITVTF